MNIHVAQNLLSSISGSTLGIIIWLDHEGCIPRSVTPGKENGRHKRRMDMFPWKRSRIIWCTPTRLSRTTKCIFWSNTGSDYKTERINNPRHHRHIKGEVSPNNNVDWVSRKQFYKPNSKILSRLWIIHLREVIIYAKLCMSPSLDGTVPEYVIDKMEIDKMVFIHIHMLGNHAGWIGHWLQSLYNIYIVIYQYKNTIHIQNFNYINYDN